MTALFIDDDVNADWLHKHQTRFVISKDGNRLGVADLKKETIETKNERLKEVFYLLFDEQDMDEFSGPDFMEAIEAQGYEIKAESEAEDGKEDPAEFENLNFQGLAINIENLRGSVRHGKTFHQRMTVPYGYIRNTTGADGDAVDVFVGPVAESGTVYVIHTRNKQGAYDEDKVMLGFESAKNALDAFRENYDDPERFFDSMEKFTITDFKYKLRALRGHKITGGKK